MHQCPKPHAAIVIENRDLHHQPVILLSIPFRPPGSLAIFAAIRRASSRVSYRRAWLHLLLPQYEPSADGSRKDKRPNIRSAVWRHQNRDDLNGAHVPFDLFFWPFFFFAITLLLCV